MALMECNAHGLTVPPKTERERVGKEEGQLWGRGKEGGQLLGGSACGVDVASWASCPTLASLSQPRPLPLLLGKLLISPPFCFLYSGATPPEPYPPSYTPPPPHTCVNSHLPPRRWLLGERKLFGVHLWFQLHRAVNLVAFFLYIFR